VNEPRDILANFQGNPPAVEASLEDVRQRGGIGLPTDYGAFLRRWNGGEGFIGEKSYVILWTAEELLELNQAYQVNEYAPGLFLFGSDGGGEAFAFDLRRDPCSVVSVPFVGMDLSLVRPVAEGFTEFLETMAQEP
jgi:hypothetical protein